MNNKEDFPKIPNESSEETSSDEELFYDSDDFEYSVSQISNHPYVPIPSSPIFSPIQPPPPPPPYFQSFVSQSIGSFQSLPVAPPILSFYQPFNLMPSYQSPFQVTSQMYLNEEEILINTDNLDVFNLQINNSIHETGSAISYKSYNFVNNKIEIPNNYHKMTPLMIISDNEVKYLKLSLLNNDLITFPLDFCNKLCNFTNQGNKYIYKIPWDKLKLKPLNVACLTYASLRFEIISDEDCDVKLYVRNEVLCEIELNKLKMSNHICTINQFQKQTVNLVSQNNTINLNFGNSAKGLFMENLDINKINLFKFYINGSVRIDYNKIMLKMFSEKISYNCFYVSLDNDLFNNDEWNGSLNLSSIDNCKIEIDSSVPQSSVNIRILSFNKIKYHDGLCGLIHESYNYIPEPPPLPYILKKTNIHKKKVIDSEIFIDKDKIEICPICRDETSNIILSCNHQYCNDCLDEVYSLDNKMNCPLCGSNIDSYNKIKIMIKQN